MGDENHEHRLTLLEANLSTIMCGIEDIKKGQEVAAEKRECMVRDLAIVATRQDAFVRSQAFCNERHTKTATRIVGFENDMRSVKSFQRNQKLAIVAIPGAIGLLINGGGKLLEKVGAWFGS